MILTSEKSNTFYRMICEDTDASQDHQNGHLIYSPVPKATVRSYMQLKKSNWAKKNGKSEVLTYSDVLHNI